MNKTILLLIAVVFASVLVFAADEVVDTDAAEPMLISANNVTGMGQMVRNMTFGSCVSDAAKVRNECYKNMANQSKTCLAGSMQEGKRNKEMAGQCRTAAKDGSKQCKNAFKETKKQQCGQIKASFMEKLRASWK